MITGTMLLTRDAVIRLRVFGSGNGIIHEVQAVIDTGFTEQLTLTPNLIEALELPFARYFEIAQSDGVMIQVKAHRVDIEWDGKRITVLAQANETEPLIGMGLIWGYKLILFGEPNGAVTLTAIEGDVL